MGEKEKNIAGWKTQNLTPGSIFSGLGFKSNINLSDHNGRQGSLGYAIYCSTQDKRGLFRGKGKSSDTYCTYLQNV